MTEIEWMCWASDTEGIPIKARTPKEAAREFLKMGDSPAPIIVVSIDGQSVTRWDFASYSKKLIELGPDE